MFSGAKGTSTSQNRRRRAVRRSLLGVDFGCDVQVRVPTLTLHFEFVMVATAGYRTRLAHPEQPGHSIVPQGPPLRSKGKNSRFNGLMRRAREAEESPARTIDRQRYSSHHPGNTRSRRSQSLHVSSISSEEVGLKGSARSHAYASARTVPMVRAFHSPRLSPTLTIYLISNYLSIHLLLSKFRPGLRKPALDCLPRTHCADLEERLPYPRAHLILVQQPLRLHMRIITRMRA